MPRQIARQVVVEVIKPERPLALMAVLCRQHGNNSHQRTEDQGHG